MKPKRLYLIFQILTISTFLQTPKGEGVPLKCDELERPQEYGDIFCTVTNLKVTHSQEIKVNTYPSFQVQKLKFMKFYDSILLYIPHKLFETFPNLNNFDAAYSEVIEIPRNTFASADNLSYLNVSHNNITDISASAFIGAPKLLRIDLSFNQIKNVNNNAFKGLTTLDRIILSNNKISVLDKTLFSDNGFLEIVMLDNNQIENIDPELFNKLYRLRDVDLTNNKILKIDPSTFQSAYNLDGVYLSGNRLTNFNLDVKNLISNLYLDNNRLTSLVINATKVVKAHNNKIATFKALSPGNLEKLFIANNSLTGLANITNFTNLVVLDLGHNNIGPINISTFAYLKRLKTLSLKATNVVGINYGTFSKQNLLEILDLSYNNLGRINLDIFVPYMSKLQEFYIDGNNLTELSGKTFSYAFPVLATLGISNNYFNCSYLHQILTPPYLSSFVKLHIEKDNSADGTPHIRGIACTSNTPLDTPGKPNITEKLPEVVIKPERYDATTIEQLRSHEKQLEQHLLMMKIFVICLFVLALCVLGYKSLKLYTEKKTSLVRSITFRSTGTVNTAVDE